MDTAELRQVLSYFGEGDLETTDEFFKDIVEQARICRPEGDFVFLARVQAEALRDTLKGMLAEIDRLFCKRSGTEGFGFKEQEEWRHRYGEIKYALGRLEERFDFKKPREWEEDR